MWKIIYVATWMVHVIFGGQVFCQVVDLCLYWASTKDLLNLEPPLCNPGYALAFATTYNCEPTVSF